jgi:hypothetical protein
VDKGEKLDAKVAGVLGAKTVLGRLDTAKVEVRGFVL